MRTNLEFRSAELSGYGSGQDTPRGEIVARLLARELPKQGFDVTDVSAEDWGWRVTVACDAFPLWVGCGGYEEWEDGHLCFIEPSKPYVRHWLKRVPTVEIIDRLATALEDVIRADGRARDLRWWTEEASNGG